MTAAGASEGDFLVHARENNPGQYIMVLMFRGKLSRHLLARNGEGIWTVNKKVFTPAKTLSTVRNTPFIGKHDPRIGCDYFSCFKRTVAGR